METSRDDVQECVGALVADPIKQQRLAAASPSEDLMTNDKLNQKQAGGIVVPALLWWAGVPLLGVILLWALFFRG